MFCVFQKEKVQSTLVISTSIISNNRLSRRENQVTKYCGKEEKLLLGSNFSPFPQYFQYIHVFLTKGVKLHSHLWNLVVRIVLSSILQIWYVEVRISRSVLDGPFDFEITRVDWMWKASTGNNKHLSKLRKIYSVFVWIFMLSWAEHEKSFTPYLLGYKMGFSLSRMTTYI